MLASFAVIVGAAPNLRKALGPELSARERSCGAGKIREPIMSAIAVLPEVERLAASVYSFGPA